MSLPSELAAFYTKVRHHTQDLTAAVENFCITHLRAAYQSQLAFIQRKSKEIYVALNEEKKSVDTYATLLQAKMQELEGQLIFPTNHGGLAIGL